MTLPTDAERIRLICASYLRGDRTEPAVFAPVTHTALRAPSFASPEEGELLKACTRSAYMYLIGESSVAPFDGTDWPMLLLRILKTVDFDAEYD